MKEIKSFYCRGSQKEIRGSQKEIRGSQREIRGSQKEIRGSQREIRGSQREIRGSQREIRGSQREIRGSHREINIDEAILPENKPINFRPRPKSELNLSYSVQVRREAEKNTKSMSKKYHIIDSCCSLQKGQIKSKICNEFLVSEACFNSFIH